MEMKAKKRRNDPELAVGNDVRRALKTDKISKSGPNWSSQLHKVENVEESSLGTKYKISGYKYPFFRHELQKVDAVEYAPGVAPVAERSTLKQEKLRERLAAQRDQVYAIVLRRREMSLLHLAAEGRAIMPGLQKEGI